MSINSIPDQIFPKQSDRIRNRTSFSSNSAANLTQGSDKVELSTTKTSIGKKIAISVAIGAGLVVAGIVIAAVAPSCAYSVRNLFGKKGLTHFLTTGNAPAELQNAVRHFSEHPELAKAMESMSSTNIAKLAGKVQGKTDHVIKMLSGVGTECHGALEGFEKTFILSKNPTGYELYGKATKASELLRYITHDNLIPLSVSVKKLGNNKYELITRSLTEVDTALKQGQITIKTWIIGKYDLTPSMYQFTKHPQVHK